MFSRLAKRTALGQLCLGFSVGFLCLLSAPAQAQAQPKVDLPQKNVLILYSEDKSHPAHELTDRGIRSAFSSNKLFGVRLYNEYLDGSRFKDPAITHASADYLRRKYAGLKIDTIIAVYWRAVDFLLKEAVDVFPNTPIVVTQLTRAHAEELEHSPRRRSITGTIFGDNITDFLVAAFQMRPGTKRVALVGGTNPNEIYTEKLCREGLAPYLEKLEIIDLTRLPMQEILSRVGSLPPDTIILFSNMFTDGAGQNFVPREALALISRAANAPVFGLFDSYLGYGIVGGWLVSFEEHGREAAALALRIMGGQLPASIPFGGEQAYVSAYDWRQLRRFKMSMSALPKGSIVINRELTFWDFKYYFIGGLAILLAQTLLVIGLLLQRRRKIVAEKSLHVKTEELDQFFNVTLDLLCVANTDGYFVRLNPAVDRVLGFTCEELMARSFFEFIHPDDVDRTREAVSALRSQQKLFLFENRYRCKDGTYRWLEWSSVPAGKLIYAAARDVTERKQAEKALEQSEEKFRLITEKSVVGIYIIQDAKMVYVNPSFAKTFGYSPEEIIGTLSPKDLIHPDDIQDVMRRFQERLEGKTERSNIVYKAIRKDGSLFYIEVYGMLIDYQGRPAVMGTLIDVTDRKRAEQVLEERLRFEQLLSNFSARFVNVTPDRVDQEIEDALKRVADFFHVTNCALVKASPEKDMAVVTHTAHPAAVAMVKTGIDVFSLFPWTSKMLREGHVVSVATLDDLSAEAAADKETYRKLGLRSMLTVPVSIEGSPRYAVSIASRSEECVWPEELIPRLQLVGEIFINALERKQIRLQIEDRLRFEGLISDLSARFVNLPTDEVDDEINRGLRSINEFFDADRCTIGLFSEDGTRIARIFEYRLAEVESAAESVSREQMPWYMEQLIHGKPVVINRLEDLPPEAEKERQFCLLRGMQSLLSIPMVSGGKTLGSCALAATRAERVWPKELIQRFRLVTEVFANALDRKRAEREAYDTRRELTRMDRLSRMGELSASLSHELNQPLTAILSNARAAVRFLQSGKLEPGELEEILQDIVKDDKRAGDIIRNLRTLVTRDEGERELISINDVLRDTVALFRSEAVIRNLRVEMDLADPLPLLYVNKVQIQQVLINLMMNAAESTTRDDSARRVIVLQTRASNGGVVQVAVCDFGPGIEDQVLHRIFEPFFTTKRSGLGMGLSLSRSIIESHGGHIWAQNNPDKGITFYFDLPGRRDE